MSDELFPTFPALDKRVRRTRAFKTEVQEAESGTELRPVLQSSPRIRWEITLKLRTADDWQEYQELEAFFDRHYARHESFLFDCPVLGTQHRVRFDSDELEIERLAPGLVTCTVELISVI